MLAWPTAAWPHASLKSTTPGDHKTVATAPDSVELRFSGPVTLDADAVEVFAPDGSRVDAGQATLDATGTIATQSLEVPAAGTYAVAWRSTSGDGHTLTGTFAFHVERASTTSTAERRSKAVAITPTNLRWGMGIARFGLLASLLVVVGGGLFSTLVVPGWRARWIVSGLLVLLVSLAGAFVIDAAIASGHQLKDVLNAHALRTEAQLPFGRAALVMAALAIIAFGPALLLRGGGRAPSGLARWGMALVFAALGASLALSGHAWTTEPTAVRLPLDMVHVVAASIWLGGLVQLLALAPVANTNITAINRFATVALGAVMVLLVTGLYAVYRELGVEPHQLLDSQYGRIILAKLLLYFGTMPLAFMNKSVYVPAIARRPADATRLLRQYVYRELFLLLVIVGVTAWLIGSDQPGG